MLEDPKTLEVKFTAHTYPCSPGPLYALSCRIKSSRNFRSIPMELLQRAASWIECKVSCQALRICWRRIPIYPVQLQQTRISSETCDFTSNCMELLVNDFLNRLLQKIDQLTMIRLCKCVPLTCPCSLNFANVVKVITNFCSQAYLRSPDPYT